MLSILPQSTLKLNTRKPTKIQSLFQKISNAYFYLKDSLNREPSVDEIHSFLLREGLEVEKDTIENYLFFNQHFISLDEPILSQDEDIHLSDTISNSGTEDIERKLIDEDILKFIDELLDTLSPREK